MKIGVLVKVVPDVDQFKYDYEKNTLIRENVKMIINNQDATALEKALKIKDADNSYVEVITMAPKSTLPIFKDIARRGVDKVTLISDKIYQGSDTYSTSIILSEYIKTNNFDLILGGTNTLDGDTGHVINQISQNLGIWSISNVLDFKVEENNININTNINDENIVIDYEKGKDEVVLLGIMNKGKPRLRFVRYDDLKKDVDEKISIIDNTILNVEEGLVGIKGSPTKIVRTYVEKYEKKDTEFIYSSNEGIDKILKILKDAGILNV